MQTLDEIEANIKSTTGATVGPNGSLTFSAVQEYELSCLNDWLSLQNVSRSLSKGGKINAYNAGREWVQKSLADSQPKRDTGFGRRRTAPMDLDFNENKTPDISLGDLLQQDSRGNITPTPNTTSAQTPREAPTQQMLADAADAVLRPRIEAATQRLSSQVASAVRDETAKQINSLGLGNKLTEEIAALVNANVLRVIEENLPRKIELKLPNGQTRTLDPAPRHEKFDQILKYLSRKRHVYIVGPAGTGKSELGRQLAEALALDFYPISPALTKYDVSGHISPTGEYIATLLRKAIEFGGLALIDEGDAWAAAAMLYLNAALSNGYCSFPDGVVQVHADFRCIIAANTYGRGGDRKYHGRNPLDAASLNRFSFVEVQYDKKLETALFGNGPWVQYCWRVRDAIETERLQYVVSMRNIQRCVEDAACGDDPEEIMSANLWVGMDEDTIQKIKNRAGTINIQQIPRTEVA